MNPPFPVQRPPQPTDVHQAAQWQALNTDATAQRAICHAAASGQLTQEQMVSFSAYMKGNGTAFRLYQIERHALQQHQQQQQQYHQLKSQLVDNDKQLSPPQAHPIPNNNPFISSSQPIHYSSPIPQASSPPQHPRAVEMNMIIASDPQMAQAVIQFRQAQDAIANPATGPSERENATQRMKDLREMMSARMAHHGIRNNNPSAASPPVSSSPPVFSQPAGQSGQPQHPNDVQRAHLSVAYQRQQQMMSNMPINPAQPNGSNNIPRPLSRNLAVPVSSSSPRPNLLSGRNSPTPNGNNIPSTTNMNSIQSISRPGSSHLISASSPPALHNAGSPPNTSGAGDLRRAVAMKTGQSIGTPPQNSSPRGQALNLVPRPPSAASGPALQAGQLSPPAIGRISSPVNQPGPPEPVASRPTPPAQVAPPNKPSNPQSQQYSAIAAQQQQAPPPPRDIQPPQPPARPHSPVPAPFPAPRPTLTGGHATSSTLAGTVLHRPPVNGIHDALGQSSGNNDVGRGGGGAGQEGSGSGGSHGSRILSKRKIQELVESIDPSERLEVEVEDLLLELADEFIDSVTRFSCQLAKHRKSDRLETKDIQLHLERSWNIRIPGFANDEIRQSQSRRVNALPSYQTRVTAVREAAKKRTR